MSSRSNAGLKLILLPQPPKPGLMFSTNVQSVTVQNIPVQLHLMPETEYLSFDRFSIVDAPPIAYIS